MADMNKIKTDWRDSYLEFYSDDLSNSGDDEPFNVAYLAALQDAGVIDLDQATQLENWLSQIRKKICA